MHVYNDIILNFEMTKLHQIYILIVKEIYFESFDFYILKPKWNFYIISISG